MQRAILLSAFVLVAVTTSAQPAHPSVTVLRPGAGAAGRDVETTHPVALGDVVSFDPGVGPWRCEAETVNRDLGNSAAASQGLPYRDLVVRCWASPALRAAGVFVTRSVAAGAPNETLALHAGGRVAFLFLRF